MLRFLCILTGNVGQNMLRKLCSAFNILYIVETLLKQMWITTLFPQIHKLCSCKLKCFNMTHFMAKLMFQQEMECCWQNSNSSVWGLHRLLQKWLQKRPFGFLCYSLNQGLWQLIVCCCFFSFFLSYCNLLCFNHCHCNFLVKFELYLIVNCWLKRDNRVI